MLLFKDVQLQWLVSSIYMEEQIYSNKDKEGEKLASGWKCMKKLYENVWQEQQFGQNEVFCCYLQ